MYAQLKSGVQGLGFRGDGGNNCKYHFTTMDIYIYIYLCLSGEDIMQCCLLEPSIHSHFKSLNYESIRSLS